jgi:hypothetical protein
MVTLFFLYIKCIYIAISFLKISFMKKSLTLLVLCVLSTINLFAQDKGHLAISGGTTTPTGDFASTDGNNSAAGFAKGGFLIDLSLNYKFNENWGVTALVRRQSSAVDAEAFINEFAKDMPAGTTTFSSSSWSIGGYMGGVSYNYELSDNTSLIGRLMVGALTANSPEMNLTYTDAASNSLWVKQNTASASSFAYLIGAGLKTNLGERFCLVVNLDYLSANPEFSGVVTEDSFGGKSTDTWSQKFGTITYSGGIGFRF